MVSQPDIAVIQEAGHVDLIHLLPSVFPVTGTRCFYRSRPASSIQPYNLISVNTWYSNEGLSAAEAWIPTAQSLGMWCQGSTRFSQAEELKMKTRWHTVCYLQDSEILQSSEVHLGDSGDVISVQVTAMEQKLRSDLCRLHLHSIQCRLGLDWGNAACQGVGNSND